MRHIFSIFVNKKTDNENMQMLWARTADEQFELYPTGTRRGVCRQCKYQLYGIEAKRRWRLRQMAALIANRRK